MEQYYELKEFLLNNCNLDCEKCHKLSNKIDELNKEKMQFIKRIEELEIKRNVKKDI